MMGEGSKRSSVRVMPAMFEQYKDSLCIVSEPFAINCSCTAVDICGLDYVDIVWTAVGLC